MSKLELARRVLWLARAVIAVVLHELGDLIDPNDFSGRA